MRKLIEGIVEFRKEAQRDYRKKFSRLADKQEPNALFVACSDSRVVPNTFASTNPGDLFVVRNVGNLVPPCDNHGASMGDESEAAAIEFSVQNLAVKDIIVCGHSGCGAMAALMGDRNKISSCNLKSWLRHGDESLTLLESSSLNQTKTGRIDHLSQINVLVQMDHIKTYPLVRERIERGDLRVHGWWFDLSEADVYSYDPSRNQFVLIDETEAQRILENIQD